MKRLHRTAWLLLALCIVTFASPLFSTQSQSVEASPGTLFSPAQPLTDLEKRLQDADDELASIRQQLQSPSTAEAKRALLERIEHLESEVRQIKADLEAAKNQRRISAVNNSAMSGCCELWSASAGSTNAEMEAIPYCKWADRNVDLRSAPHSKSVSNTCFTDRKIIDSQRLGDLAISLTNDQGQLTTGQDSFCVEFRSIIDNSAIDPTQVQVEATMVMGKVNAIRAVVRLSHLALGRYCAQVDFPLAGSWIIAVKHKGSSGKRKTIFLAAVN